MNKKKQILAAIAIALTLGLSANNFALSKTSDFNVAIVDVQKVVSASSEVNALKNEQKAKVDELVNFVETAKANLAKESDDTKKKALEDKYNKELNVKKDAIDKEYVKKLSAIDKDITEIIKKKADKDNYDLVLSKSSVLIGGKDITDEIIKAVK